MTKKVLITGAAGTVGRILRRTLTNYKITPVDIVPVDDPYYQRIDVASDYSGLKNAMQGQDAVIHLAWDMRENFNTDVAVPENKTMTENVYRAAMETTPHPRVIIASSVHAAGGYIDWSEEPYCFIAKREFVKLRKCQKLIRPDMQPFPDSIYGASKVYMESLGMYYSPSLPNTAHDIMAIRLRGWVDQHYSEPLDMGDAANSIGVRPRQLRRSFQKRFGISAYAYQRKVRVMKALEMLEGPEWNKVEWVALNVGYRSKQNFIRAFRDLLGTTPRGRSVSALKKEKLSAEVKKSPNLEGLQVVALRLGGVNPEDRADIDEKNWCYHASWLSHRDCAEIFRGCIETELPPFSILFAISNNKYRVFDISETEKALGYTSHDDSARFL
ncbi:MAG: helix-turn-helix domain-containing protein [Candidatus Aenigmarchaeota archaeon]|nr:helix-turn-helix domain-containing protein [Candidatus Aenigmarchaeota archaeon]